MATTNIFEKLKNLQDILVKKYELENEIEEAPKQLSSQEELLARMKKEYIEKNAEYDNVKTEVGKLKLELDEAVKSRENGEKGMDNISTHREYEALEKQILEATDRENDIRKQLQKEDKQLEEIKETLKINEEMINAQENDLQESKNQLNEQLEAYNNQLKELKVEEDKITPDLNQEILFKFQRIIQRNSEGIVAVKGGVCTGCHMILPAQFANTVRENSRDEAEDVLFCPYCSRILFYEETENEEDTYYLNDDIGSLSDLSDLDDEEKKEYGFDDGDETDEEERDSDSLDGSDYSDEDDMDRDEDDEDENLDDDEDEDEEDEEESDEDNQD